MKKIKYLVWIVGIALEFVGLFVSDLGTEANWIQFISGIPMIWAFGEYLEKRQHIKEFVHVHKENQKRIKANQQKIMEHVQSLHEKIDSKEEK